MLKFSCDNRHSSQQTSQCAKSSGGYITRPSFKSDRAPRRLQVGQSRAWMLRVANSTPMVDLLSSMNSLRVKRLSRLDFPTPESPMRTTLKR